MSENTGSHKILETFLNFPDLLRSRGTIDFVRSSLDLLKESPKLELAKAPQSSNFFYKPKFSSSQASGPVYCRKMRAIVSDRSQHFTKELVHSMLSSTRKETVLQFLSNNSTGPTDDSDIMMCHSFLTEYVSLEMRLLLNKHGVSDAADVSNLLFETNLEDALEGHHRMLPAVLVALTIKGIKLEPTEAQHNELEVICFNWRRYPLIYILILSGFQIKPLPNEMLERFPAILTDVKAFVDVCRQPLPLQRLAANTVLFKLGPNAPEKMELFMDTAPALPPLPPSLAADVVFGWFEGKPTNKKLKAKENTSDESEKEDLKN